MPTKSTSKTVSARMTLEQYGIICQKAGKKNINVSDYILEQIFKTPPQLENGGLVKANDRIAELEAELKKQIEFKKKYKADAEKVTKLEAKQKLKIDLFNQLYDCLYTNNGTTLPHNPPNTDRMRSIMRNYVTEFTTK